MRKFLSTFGIIFTGFFLFSAGFDASRHHYSQMALEFIEAAFWLGLVTFCIVSEVNEAIDKAAHHNHKEQAEQFAKELIERLDDAFEDKGSIKVHGVNDLDITKLADKFMEIVTTVVGGKRAPNTDEQALIVAQFHDLTGHYARFIGEQKDTEGNIQISNEPFGTSIPVNKKPSRAVKVPVRNDQAALKAKRRAAGLKGLETRKRNEAANAKLTKSQQRRMAAMKKGK